MKKNFLFTLMIASSAAVSCAQTDANKTIADLSNRLRSGDLTISKILSDKSYMSLHSLTPFREMIRENAKSSEVTIVTANEPGQKIKVTGSVIDKDRKAVSNALMYFYHTNDRGLYGENDDGDSRAARLFGYVRTNEKGEFTIHTIKPRGYPGSEANAHIHLQFWDKDGNEIRSTPGEFLFEDDPRMNAARKREAMNIGFLVSANSGTANNPVYNYKIQLK